MPPRTARLKIPTGLLLAIIVLITVAVRLPLLDIPFERDEGEYAYIAWRLGHGELPYRDWVDQKPPAIFWVYRAALALPMESIRAVHFMGMLWAAASACALFFLARGFLTELRAGAVSVLFALILADPLVQGTAANTELFMLLPLILSHRAFFCAVPEGAKRRWFMLSCGALTGIAVAFKQVAGVNWLLLVALFPLFAANKGRLRSTLEFVGWSAAGGAAVWLPIAVYFYLRNGLPDLIYHVFTHNLEYVSAISWPDRWRMCLETLQTLSTTQFVVWAMSIIGLVALFLTGRKKLLVYLGGWLVASMVGVSASGYYFPHYFQQLLPVFALVAVMGAEWVWCLRQWSGAPAFVRSAVLALLLVGLPALSLFPYLFKYTPTQAVQKIYPQNSFGEMPALGARLAQLTKPDDKVFVFGAEPELLFYARRVSATRYIFLFPLYGPYSDALQRQKATAEEITRARPAAAFYVPNLLFSMPGSEQFFTKWSLDYLESNYNGDRYLTADASGHLHMVLSAGGREPVVPHGHVMVGALLVRAKP